MRIDGKVFVITGAGGGIGGALVTVLLQRGALVIATDSNKKSLEALARRHSGAVAAKQLATYPLNITDSPAIQRFARQASNLIGPVDGLINCAGIVQPFVPLDQLDDATIQRVMSVNFYGPLSMVRAFLPQLRERPEASIVNVSSMGGFVPVPGQTIYGASKAAVKLMTEGLYAELINTKVHVSVALPGATDTHITANSGVEIAPSLNEAAVKADFPMLSPKKAAEIIVRGIEKNKLYIFTGKDSVNASRLYRLNPVLAVTVIARSMKRLLNS